MIIGGGVTGCIQENDTHARRVLKREYPALEAENPVTIERRYDENDCYSVE